MSENASIAALVAAHGKWLIAFLRGLAGDGADAEDAFQETWLRLLRAKRELQPVGIKSYLAKTARSVLIDRLRRRRPELSLDATAAGGGEEGGETPAATLADGADDPAAKCQASATAAEVRRAIAALPANWRQVVLMRIEAEMEFKEIAAELGVPTATALTWMHRATAELKKRLGGVK